jgi:hypothetical protein
MGPERIELSAKERERLKVLQQVEEGHLRQVEAARRLRSRHSAAFENDAGVRDVANRIRTPDLLSARKLALSG